MNDGGQAFPIPGGEGNYADTGMTLRDWFAGQVAAAMAGHTTVTDSKGVMHMWGADKSADHAYKVADALLAVREKSR